jgi:homeobox protein cut-like
LTRVDPPYVRVKDFEKQISELESETERLSRTLEAQKHAVSDMEIAGNKKIEETSKEIHRKVRVLHILAISSASILDLNRQRRWSN